MTAILVGVGLLLLTEIGWAAVGALLAVSLVVVWAPLLAPVLVASVGLGLAVLRVRAKRQENVADATDLAVLCDLTALSLAGGLALRSSLELAAAETGGRLGAEVTRILREGRIGGTVQALAAADGVGRRLYRTLARTAATGAAMLPPISQLADDLNAEVATRRLELIRKKPVAMLFPLTLLILPGFLLLAIAPAILDALGRLDV